MSEEGMTINVRSGGQYLVEPDAEKQEPKPEPEKEE